MAVAALANNRANGKLNGQTAATRRTLKQRRGLFSWALSFVTRIATWAAIYTILFRCPQSLEACDANSPLICKPYFRVRHAVTPHVQPYFDQYAAPYVDVVKPYYDTLNSRVLTPTRQYVVLYGTPWVNKGQDFAVAQWELNGQPQLVRLQTLTKSHYDQSIAPHLAKAGEVVGPYYNVAREHSVQAYNNYVLPGYEFARPYAAHGYDVAAEFTTTTALPATYWAWGKANAFLDTAVWPQLRVVYVQNVEPQLVRIGERLARYKTKSNTTSNKAAFDEFSTAASSSTVSISSSFSKPPPQSSLTSSAMTRAEEPEPSSTESAKTEPTQYWNPVRAPDATENESEQRRAAREMVASDLATWQNKFAAQAEEGASAIEDQVDEIARRIMNENARVTGKDLLQQLEDTIASEVANLRQKISAIVESGSADSHQETVSVIRVAGAAIKKKAQLIRGWREDYDAELEETVLDAADVHFQILDETRSLALQNIGMKWAWTDGVTYKDWQKYHELKSALNNWTEELKQLIVTHPTLLEAQELSHQIEDDGMTTASVAAKELARLKQVSSWKIVARDFTDNFDSEEMRLAAEAAEQAKVEAAAAAAEQAKVEAAAAEQAAKAEAEKISEQTQDEPTANDDAVRNDADIPDDKPAEPAVMEPSPELEVETPTPEPREAPIVLPAEDTPTIFAKADDGEPDIEPEEAPESMGEATAFPTPDLAENVSAATEDEDETATAPAKDQHTPVSPVMFGAAAQSVANRGPILDEDPGSDILASVTSAAQAAYSSAVAMAADRYSSAFSVVSAQVESTPKPVHEQLFSSVSAAYDVAMSAASQKLNTAVAAASSGVYDPAPTATKSSTLPDWKKVESIAAQRLNEGKLWAEVQYQSVLIALGAATPTPTSSPDKFYEQAKYHYYAGLGMAQDRYSSFMSAASSAWSSVTATPTPTPTNFAGSASSIASGAVKSARSAADAADEAVKSAYSAASDGVISAAQDAEGAISQVADAAAEQVVNVAGAVVDTWDVVVSRLSIDVYGQPTAIGWFGGATQTASSAVVAATEVLADSASAASDAAAKQFDAVNKIVSELVSEKEPTLRESVMSRLSAIYATATSNVGSMASEASVAAASVGDKVGSAASKATEAVKDTVQQARDEL